MNWTECNNYNDCPDDKKEIMTYCEIACTSPLMIKPDEYCNTCFAKQILTLVKEAGYVKLADDQSLPDGGFYETTAGYSEAVRIMLKAGWRKINML